MTWHIISNSYSETKTAAPYYMNNGCVQLSVYDDCIISCPNIATVHDALMEIHTTRTLVNWNMAVNDSLSILNGGFTIPLGPLTIYFGDGDPCPILSWSGNKCDDFVVLNKPFEKYLKLKEFW